MQEIVDIGLIRGCQHVWIVQEVNRTVQNRELRIVIQDLLFIYVNS